jgi:hypothetical protein
VAGVGCVRADGGLSCPAMRLGRGTQILPAMLLLGVIGADIVGGRCDLPQAAGWARTAPAATVACSTEADACVAGCVPDCFSCSRSEPAAPVAVGCGPARPVPVFVEPETRVRDGVRPLPYHPPLDLL